MADGTILVTNAGLAAVVNANRSGTEKVTISKVGLGTGKYTPDASRTEMYAKFKELSTISGGGLDSYTIHVEIRDESSDAYTVNELGIFLSDGTLFAIASSEDPILQKAGGSVGVLVCDIRLSDVSVENIIFGSTNFSVPQATETTSGVAEIATLEEAATGEDHSRIVTPKGLKQETDKLVHLSGNEIVSGTKTFSSTPKSKTPSANDNSTFVANTEWVKSLIAATLLAAHPIGSYYITEGEEKPGDLFGGTWTKIQNRFLMAASETYAVGSTGGTNSVTLTTNELPAHTHTASTASSGGHTHTATTANSGSHSHTGTTNSAGNHYHGSMGENTSRGSGPYGLYDGNNTHAGSNGGQDNDNAIYKTSTNGAHTHSFTTGSSGGHTHTLTTASNGSHTHTVTVTSTGSGKAFSILNPYRAVYMWRRTA